MKRREVISRVPAECSEAEREPGPSARVAKRNIALTAGPRRIALGPGSSLALHARSAGTRVIARRAFLSLIGGAAAAWPLAAPAQQPAERMRRIGVIIGSARDADDDDVRTRLAAFQQALQELGWIDGRNVRIEYRLGAGDADRIRRHAAELVAFAPDVILASGTSTAGALQQATRTVPIVLVNVADPVGAGFVDSLARPGGNITGFLNFEYSLAGKWLELLKQIAPGAARVAVIRDPGISAGTGQFGAIQSVAPSFGVELTPVNVREGAEIERAIAAFARSSNGGLIVTGSALAVFHRNTIITLAARYKLPAVYSRRLFAASGGLTSYGADLVEPHRRAAGYVDRILKGEKPADLPVQAPTKYELIINLKTAKALGLEVSPMLLARADEVIE
jgi:putative ABC transport system substrate-binding protein